MAMSIEGVEHEVAFPGLNPLQFTNTPNSGVAFFTLKPFDQRKHSAEEISELNRRSAASRKASPSRCCRRRSWAWATVRAIRCSSRTAATSVTARCRTRSRPSRARLRRRRHGLSDQQLPGQRAAARRRGRSRQGQGAGRAADRTVRHAADLPRFGLRQRLQHVRPHLAGDRAGRRPFRDSVEDIANLRTRNADGEMVPIGSDGDDQARPTAPTR